jgi:hypothetical protein
MTERPDVPRAGLFNKHSDAVHEAHFRASLVRRRYQVHYDPANRWWYLRETHELLEGHRDLTKGDT